MKIPTTLTLLVLAALSQFFLEEAFAKGAHLPKKAEASGKNTSPAEPKGEDVKWAQVIKENGGRYQNAAWYPDTDAGFERFIHDSGAEYYEARDLIVPNSLSAARRCGLTNLRPPQKYWVRGAALLLWVESIGQKVGKYPRIRNWWRPKCYNSAVGGASRSDHIEARAIDIDFATSAQRREAQNILCKRWRKGQDLQIGLGHVSIHFGIASPYGKRNWFYGSYRDSDRNKTCFDR